MSKSHGWPDSAGRAIAASLFLAIGTIAPQPAQAAGDIRPTALRCEYLVNPMGIDAVKPRLSWKLEADTGRRGAAQTAWQILVAGSPEKLARGEGDVWDSGKIASDRQAQIEYAGRPLASRTDCWWKVRVWDASDHVSDWSSPAHWTMGLLKPEDWSAKWIRTVSEPFKPVQLVIRKAIYEAAEGPGAADVTARLAAMVKPDGLTVQVDNDVFGGDPAHLKVKRLVVTYELDGVPGTQTAAEGSTLSIPDRRPADTDTSRYLRRRFEVDGKIRKATLFVTALGLYEMHINGRKVGDQVLAPDWTDYNKRIRYQTYDVTDLVRRGGNAIGALLGHGWYSGHIGNGGYQHYGKQPALLAQLEIELADGTTRRIVTDGNWRSHAGPVLASDIMLGESYDARLELPDWDTARGGEDGWIPARVCDEAPRSLDSQTMEPVRELMTLKPRSVKPAGRGRWIFDLGQNMVGVARLSVSAPAGTKLTLRHAEMLTTNGNVYTTNLRKALATDTYICKGGDREVWQPRFTFHGFRYLELSGLKREPALDTITGVVLGSDTPRAGEFACSDPRVNQLYSNILWGQRGNYLSVPTDCPQRDERLGWMGDAEVFMRTATYNADVAAFHTKWLVDVDDGRGADGAFADVSPHPSSGTGTPAWGDAGVICPSIVHRVYGDTRQLEAHYPAMKRWVEWCRERSHGLIRDTHRGSDYGDWLAIGANTPKDLIGTAYFARSTRLVADAARALGKTEDAATYDKLFADIKTAFAAKYVQSDGRVAGETQTGYLLALAFDLLPAELQGAAAQHLVDNIKAKGNHLSTGFVGAGLLLPALTAAGRGDVACKLFVQDTYPSWLFPVKCGATTIWERWDGWTPMKGFQNPGMNSFNHYAFGACGEWMFASLAGIDTEEPGFGKIVIRPMLPPEGAAPTLSWVRAAYDSIRGRIAVRWEIKDSRLHLDVTIPPNTSATIYVPTSDPDSVTESGAPASASKGVQFLRFERGAAVYRVGAGHYRFVAKP